MNGVIFLFASLLTASASAVSLQIDCYDGMSFGAGRIVISESEESYTLHLRNYAKHGRLVEDLADDLGVDLGEHRRLTWVRVSPKKASCKVQASNPVLMSCNETTKVTFLSGWQIESLKEIGSTEGEISFSIDEGNFKSLNGFSSEGNFSIASLSVTNDRAYDSQAHVKILSDYCRPPFVIFSSSK